MSYLRGNQLKSLELALLLLEDEVVNLLVDILQRLALPSAVYVNAQRARTCTATTLPLCRHTYQQLGTYTQLWWTNPLHGDLTMMRIQCSLAGFWSVQLLLWSCAWATQNQLANRSHWLFYCYLRCNLTNLSVALSLLALLRVHWECGRNLG